MAYIVEKLRRDHAIDDFDCGKEPLNRFLKKHAFQNQQSNASQTYMLVEDKTVCGYYTLVVGSVEHHEAPARLTKGQARHPIPIMLLARMAVSSDSHGMGIGPALLKDALQRTLQAADIAGIRAFAVHAEDDEARGFYEHFDFIPSPTDKMHLMLLLKDVKALLK